MRWTEEEIKNIVLEPGMVIMCDDSAGRKFNITILKTRRYMVAVAGDAGTIEYREYHKDSPCIWTVGDLIRSNHFNLALEQIQCIQIFHRSYPEPEEVYVAPQKIELSVEEIEKRLCLEPGTLVIKSEYDSPELEEHYDHFGM